MENIDNKNVAVTETAAAESIGSIDIGVMELNKTEFYLTEGGFTGLRYDGNDHKHITLRRTLPIGRPMEYISVADAKNNEIGIIKSVLELSGEQLEIVLKELDRRYYCPEILEVKSVKDKLGYVYMELLLDVPGEEKKHVKNCAVKDVNRNIRMLTDDSLIIFDVDGNRYIIKNIVSLDKQSLKRLEPFLF